MAINKGCIIVGCDRQNYTRRNMCNTHYLRLRRHGDINYAERPANGTVQKWFDDHLNWEGDDCLIWPFVCDRDGRGKMSRNGKTQFVHREYCIEINGPPPSDIHEAAHECGQGRKGCVHPKHVNWKLPIENTGDKVKHGTQFYGTQVHGSKLDELKVIYIRANSDKYTRNQFANMYGVDSETVRDVLQRKTWKWL